jgi:hypothetical protein
MAVSPLQRAKRAFVIVLQSIAAAYSVQLDVTRESADNLVTSAFRRVAKKVHPDKGGKLVDSQRLLAARQLWEDALRAAGANGRPVSGKSSATSSSQFSLSWAAESRRPTDDDDDQQHHRHRHYHHHRYQHYQQQRHHLHHPQTPPPLPPPSTSTATTAAICFHMCRSILSQAQRPGHKRFCLASTSSFCSRAVPQQCL